MRRDGSGRKPPPARERVKPPSPMNRARGSAQPFEARAARLRRPLVPPLAPDVSLPPLMPVLEPPLVPPLAPLEPPEPLVPEPPLVEPPALEPPDAPLLRPAVPPEVPPAPPDWLALEPPDIPPDAPPALPPPAPELCANTTPTAVDSIAADKTAIHFFFMGHLSGCCGDTPRFVQIGNT